MIQLNDEHHFYFHQENGRRYPSVTSSMLEMIKPKFDGDSIIDNMLKSYQNFNTWYHSLPNKNPQEYFEILELYYTYKNYRPFVIAEWNGEEYKKYKKLKTYKSKNELRQDLALAKFESVKDINFKRPKIYANTMFELKSKPSIKALWKALTDIANVYGTMVHEICELWFTHRYNNDRYTIDLLNEHIQKGWDTLKEMVEKFTTEYPRNKWCFEQYKINISLEEFSKHIQDSFLRLNPNLGIHCISEKILFSRKNYLCGTTDTLIDITPSLFDIEDYKTNARFTTEAEEKLLYPFHEYDNCDRVLYGLQMSTYGRMHEINHNEEKKCRAVWVAYFDRTKNEFERIDLEYQPRLADELLEMHRIFIMKLVNKWKKSPHFSKILMGVPKPHRMYLCTLLEKRFNEMNKVVKDTEMIKDSLESFVKNEYITWKNVV